jgi:hypothetical protein
MIAEFLYFQLSKMITKCNMLSLVLSELTFHSPPSKEETYVAKLYHCYPVE